MPVRVDLVGYRFGRLIVKAMMYGEGKTRALCCCDCGNTTTVLTYNLRNGNTKSCGCLAREHSVEQGRRVVRKAIAARRRHGMSRTATYVAWLDARKRCYREKDSHYSLYGGRGIAMCAEWKKSFDPFLRDMGECPDGMSLDRIDVNGNYEPGNCRWISMAEQSRNTRTNVATWESVSEIRRAYAEGESQRSIAIRFHMSKSNVQMIVTERTWPESQRPIVETEHA